MLANTERAGSGLVLEPRGSDHSPGWDHRFGMDRSERRELNSPALVMAAWSIVDQLEEGDVPFRHGLTTTCLNWPGARNSKGYGAISVRGETEYVHRVIYRAFVGDLNEAIDETVHHLCENKVCCARDHLECRPRSSHVAEHNRKRKGTRTSKEARIKRMNRSGVRVYFDPTRIESRQSRGSAQPSEGSAPHSAHVQERARSGVLP
jgi:hypothetical protein